MNPRSHHRQPILPFYDWLSYCIELLRWHNAASTSTNDHSMLFSLHTQRLEHRIHRVGVEPSLELGEQLAGDRRDVLHACHR